MLLIVTCVFVLVVLLVFTAGCWFEQHRAQARLLHARLAYVHKTVDQEKESDLELLRDELLSEIPAMDRLLRRSNHITDLQQYLAQAALTVRAGRFLMIAMLAFVLFAVVGLMLTKLPAGAILCGVLGGMMPFLFASYRRGRRFRRFEEEFPEAIDLLARAVRAGHAFPTSLELIANEMADPLAGEFRILFEEQKFGLPMREALTNLVSRIPIIDVKFFVTAVMLQRETGGNLAEILDKLSYVIRERFKIHRQVRVHTAEGRLTMGILMALPPGVVALMIFTNPHFIRVLWVDPLGHLLIGMGVVLQTIGFFVIRRIIRIEV
jgi:tight adherence protein B